MNLKIFRKRDRAPLSSRQEFLAVRMARFILYAQTRIAGFLNSRASNLTSKGKKAFLSALCFLLGGWSLWLLLNGFMK